MPARRLSQYALTALLAFYTLPAASGSLEQAKRIHDRLAGVPASAAVLTQMQTEINNAPGQAGLAAAAQIAMDNPAFYGATLKNWASPWTNRDDDKFAALNDYTATVIGIVRDELDYRQVLFGDIIYVGVSTGYSRFSNAPYEQLEASGANLGSPAVLEQRVQSQQNLLPANATAGVMTSRAAARAFFIDGTNRAMFRFTLKNHLCNDLEQVQDITRPADRIRKDVTRSPGGDSRIFMNTCVGCHSGMDPLAQAFAYYNFAYSGDPETGSIQYTPGVVQDKYHINENSFPDGYDTPDDHWDNYWRNGPNTAIFGWANPASMTQATAAARFVDGIYGDAGAKTMGEELANSEAFAVCSVKKVFKVVCLRDPDESDRPSFANMLASFKSDYNLKSTFAEAAAYCAGN